MAGIKKNICDVFISGGGIPGLALASLLGQAGFSVVVADPSPLQSLKQAAQDGRTSALMHGSVEILKKTGVWDNVASYGNPLKTLAIIDDASRQRKPLRVDFKAQEIDLDYFGVNMPNAVLRSALGTIAASLKNVRIVSASLKNFEMMEGGVSITTDKGLNYDARLLVGADGRHSKVRDIASIPFTSKDYGQNAITCLIDHSRPHNDISTEFHRPGGPFTLVPLPGNRSSVVWVDFKDKAESFMRLNKSAFERALQERSQNILGKITLASSPESWPLSVLKAQRLTAPRVALAAEAAHVIHPLGAQGLNLSPRDIHALSSILQETQSLGLDIGSKTALTRYEKERRGDILLRIRGVDTLTHFVSHDNAALQQLRRMGLKTVSEFSPLRDIAMRQGLAA